MQKSIVECMDQIEVSIRLSMSGVSFQPDSSSSNSSNGTATTCTMTVVPAPAAAAPKVIPQQPGFYPHSTSTTPTDVMELSTAYVC